MTTSKNPVAPYGYCPRCGAAGLRRERSPNGNDRCANGHVYPSKTALLSLERDRLELAAPYGIIDPDYARVYTIIRCLAWSYGYATGMHGSFTRDLDLILAPWVDTSKDPEHLVAQIADQCGLKIQHGSPSSKPHGRLTWTLLFPAFGDPRWVDLSVMPCKKE